MKYCKEICDKIFALLESDEYSQAEICRIVGINVDTFTDWKRAHSEFSDGIIKARERLTEKRLVQCKRSLSKLILGYVTEEERTEYVDDGTGKGKAKVRAQYVIKKEVPPNLGAIIHYQTNMDPEHWQNKQRFEHTGKDGEELPLRPLTAEEIEYLKANAQ
jgi:hypothetical protein